MNYPSNLSPEFRNALRKNREATQFFYSVTATQQQKIMDQTQMINTPKDMEEFVSHLPSAAL